MKFRNTFRFALLMAFVIVTLVSCSSEDSKNTVKEITNTVKEGTWKIGYFYDSGADKTQNYTGYIFTFGDNTILTASKETNTYTGQWSVGNSTSDDDLYSTIFKISIGPMNIFEGLNGNWKVIENTGTSLKLKDDSHGDLAIDYLNFEKIVQ